MKPAWFRLQDPSPFTERTLEETLIGGQAFRWYRDAKNACWTGIWDCHVASLRQSSAGALEAALWTPHTTGETLLRYLASDRIPGWIGQLPCNADPVLQRLRDRWEGLSILRQPAAETLLAFICSANKQILQIRSMVKALSLRFGEPVQGTPFHALPGWERLASAPEEELRQCGLGYRAAHVAGTARFLAANPDFLEQVSVLPTADAGAALQRLPGVGPKVADCVLLFGYGRADAFPVDTWIEKILKESYPELARWTRPQLATFARIHFGQAGGLAQQWFFAEARSRQERKRGRTNRPAL